MGLGQVYNRQYMKGLLMLLLYFTGLYFIITVLPKALWGLVTLGDKADRLEKVGRVYVNVRGDHSIFLMVEGIIALLAALVLVYIYALNIRDAYRVGKLRDEGGTANGFGTTVKRITEERFPLLVLSIPLLLVVFFTAMPILFMVLLAFTNFSFPNYLPPAKLVDWTGFKSFVDMFNVKAWSGTFIGVTVWTLIWMVSATVTVFFGGFLVALLVQMKGIRFKGFWRTLFIIPYAIPQFISLLIMKNMFNGQFGPINQYLSYFGLGKLPWLTDPFWAKVTVIIVNIWIGFPITMLMIIGILSTISKDLYEAAEMDGASGYRQFRAITLPSIMYAFGPILVMSFAGNINNFNLIFLLTGGAPANADYKFAGSTDILITWLYNLTLTQGKYNYASVIGLFIFIVIASLSIWNIRRTKAFKEEGDFH
ncbi:sugar ABC transporter permease [Cohnella faecalis]|uniref:Maltose/maltodextrin transport system permease protein n=2 Tax=Cohnella faecalis TaxID=2315694 RepID=A0A398CRV4_9BACL|nr:sugar ABC transporter permease [Cohnella faecalis]